MRHDSHYVEELVRANKTIGKIIPLENIIPNPDQPRVDFGDLTDLTASIREQGVLEPLLVKPNRNTGKYLIIAGERRWRASGLAGLEEVPCIELDIDEQTIAEIALVENLQRKDLTIWEIADGLADLSERYNYTHADIAKKIGKSRSTVTEAIAIAGLPSDIRNRCVAAKINSKSVLIEISRQFDGKAMHELLDRMESNDLTRDQIRHGGSSDKISAGKIKENKISAADTSPNSIEVGSDVHSNKVFNFNSITKDFKITIRFKRNIEDEREILKALKEAFDTVKADSE